MPLNTVYQLQLAGTPPPNINIIPVVTGYGAVPAAVSVTGAGLITVRFFDDQLQQFVQNGFFIIVSQAA